VTQLVQVSLDNGQSIFVEVADATPVIEQVGRGHDIAQAAAQTLEDALSRVRPAIEGVVRQIRQGIYPPQRVTVDFGIKITAEAGVVIAKAATEANFTVSAEWTHEPAPSSPQTETKD
jgi:inner membrane protein involved in colicin E2 resistance